MSGSGKQKSDWNKVLLEDTVATAYARLLLSAAVVLGPTPAFLSLWPTAVPNEPWASMVKHVYEQVR